MQNIGIFYGSSTGNTEGAAKDLQNLFGKDVATVFDVADAGAEDIENFSNLIFGCSTWGIGDLQDDFETFIKDLQSADLNGKKVAIFGFGDQDTYPDSFVDAIGEIYEAVAGKGCEVVGKVSTDGYDFDDSRAVIDGEFVGLPLDEENQSNLTETRLKNWAETLKKVFN
jgi:flavodoxin I